MKRTLPTLLLTIGLLLGFAASAPAQNTEDLREPFSQSFPLAANGRISLENISGAVKITAWDRNEVKVDAVKRASSRERLNEMQIQIEANNESIDIRTEYPERTYRYNKDEKRREQFAYVDYTLTVPRNAQLDGIELVSGRLEIEGLTGDVKASVVSGSVTARGLTGEAEISTVSGRLEAMFDRLGDTKAISLSSVSGALTLTIPSDSNAQLRANTVSGAIANDFGLPVRRGEYVGRDLAGSLGNGGTRIKLGNVSGMIAIRRAQDGRPLSPATNQLPETKDDDGDEDDDDDEARNIRREAQRAARDAAREARRAQLEAQREQMQAQRATAQEQIEAQREARAAQAEAQREAREAQRVAQVDAQRAVRESQRVVREQQREIQRAARDAQRAAREATRDLYIHDNEDLRLVERESKSFTVSGTPRVVLNTFDGRISIRAWDKPEVSLTAIKRAGNEQALRGITVSAEQSGSDISINTNYDKSAAGRTHGNYSYNASVTLEVSVPRNANISAHTGDGRVELEGVSGGLRLQTGDGRIDVQNSSGQLIAQTGDGRIEVINYNGDADIKTGDGRINLDGRFTQLAAKTGDGSISLALPSDLDATIETDAEEVSGEGINTEADANVGKRLRRFNIGRGGTLFRLNTGDGHVYLRRR